MSLDMIIAPNMNVPMVVAPTGNLLADPTRLFDLISEHRVEIMKQLYQYGAFLFRGFACHNAEYFSRAIEACGLGNRCSTEDYNIPRTVLPNNIYTSSDFPAHVNLPLHHEKPRSKIPPNHIYFCCVTPAKKGGGTLFANAASIWQDMPNTIRENILKYGVSYQQFFHGESIKQYVLQKILDNKSVRSWSKYFGTDEKLQIENKLSKSEVNWSWVNKGNDLIVLNVLPGVLKHPMTNQTVWFNAANYLNYYSNLLYDELNALPSYKYLAYRYLILKDMLPLVCHYGNGTPFSFGEINEIIQVLQTHSCVLNWQEGDFMIVDNFTFMHGKQPHQGARLLYSCMTML